MYTRPSMSGASASPRATQYVPFSSCKPASWPRIRPCSHESTRAFWSAAAEACPSTRTFSSRPTNDWATATATSCCAAIARSRLRCRAFSGTCASMRPATVPSSCE